MASKSKRASTTRRQRRSTQSAGIWARGRWWLIGGGVVGAIALLVVLTGVLSGPEASGGEVPIASPPGSGVLSGPEASGGEVPIASPPGSSVALPLSDLPDFTLALYQGRDILGASEVQFASLLGNKPIVLNYFASNCPPCEAEMPELEQVWRKYKDRVLFVGLDIGRFAGFGGPQASKQLLTKLGITYPAAPAPNIETLQKLGIKALPSTDFITPDGKMHKRWVGILNKAKLTELVESLLNPDASRRSEVGQAVPVLTALHAPPYSYNTRPPTSGNHLAALGPYGISATPLQAELVVHNMEHGAVVIWYQPGDVDLADQVRRVVRELGGRCLVAGPYYDMDYKVAVTAWGRLLGLNTFDTDSIRAFVVAYRGKLGPEADDARVSCKVYP